MRHLTRPRPCPTSRSVPVEHLRLLPQVAVTIALSAIVDALVRLLPLRRVCTLLGVPLAVSAQPCAPGQAVLDPAARRRVLVARRVLEVVPWDGRCLRRSLVLGVLLRRHSPVLRLGVASRAQGPAFHAWLEVAGLAVEADGADFVPLAG